MVGGHPLSPNYAHESVQVSSPLVMAAAASLTLSLTGSGRPSHFGHGHGDSISNAAAEKTRFIIVYDSGGR